MINKRLYKFSNILSSEVEGQSPPIAALGAKLLVLIICGSIINWGSNYHYNAHYLDITTTPQNCLNLWEENLVSEE